MTRSAFLILGCLSIAASLALPRTAHALALAYVDPLSGSVVLQVLAAGVLGALFSARTFLRRVQDSVRTAWAKLTRR